MKWRDLLGTPYKLHGCGKEGMDCSTVAESVLRRLGMAPPATNPFRAPTYSGQEMTEYFSTMEEAYERIGGKCQDAKKEGDVVLSYDAEGRPSGLFVLVDEAKGLFLTSMNPGGVRAARRYHLGEVAGVYRLRGGQL